MSVKEPTGDLKKACWKGYTAIGMKKKNGRKVPNCVPVSEEECPVRRQYKELKKLPIEDLRGRIKQSSRVIDVSGFDKESAISHILRSQHGHKRVNQAFGLDEETGRNATDAEHKKTLDTLLKRPDLRRTLRSLKRRDQDDKYNTKKEKEFKDSLATKLRERSEQMREEHADKLKGTPVVSLSDFSSKDDTKNKYGQTVPKKLKKDDPRVKFHKDTIKEAAQGHTIEAQGIRGMKGTAWRKTFKSYAHLAKWADANDSVEVHGTRDLDQAKRKKQGTMEEAATSDNTGYGKGYHGNIGGDDEKYSSMHTKVIRLVGAAGDLSDVKKPNVMIKHFLDSTHGRHIADQPSDSNITSRFKKFKNTYNPEMHKSIDEGMTKAINKKMKNTLSAIRGRASLGAPEKEFSWQQNKAKAVKAGRAMAKEEVEQMDEAAAPGRDASKQLAKLIQKKTDGKTTAVRDSRSGLLVTKKVEEEVEQMDEGNRENKGKKNKYVADIIKKKLSPEVLSSLKFGRRELKKEEAEQMDESTVSALDAVRQFASRAHEDWRKTLPPNERNVPRPRSKNGGPVADINVPFHKLHPSAQKENLDAGKAALRAVIKHGGDTESASEHVHNEWMRRNPKSDYNAHQHVPYHELPEDEKQKDRDHVVTMRSILSSKRKTKLGESYQMNEKHLTPAERKKREEIAQAMERKSPGMDMGKKMAIATAQAKKVAEGYGSGGQFGPKRYGSREDDFGHEAPDRDHVHSEPKDHGLTVHNHEGKEIGTVPKRHFEPMTAAMNIAMKYSRATGENTEVRRFGKKVESFKGKKVNEQGQIDELNQYTTRVDAANAMRKSGNPGQIEPHPRGGYRIKHMDRGRHMMREANRTRNIIREVIKNAVNKAKTETGSPMPKIKMNPTALDNLGNRRGIGGT